MDVVALSNLLNDFSGDDEKTAHERNASQLSTLTPASFGPSITNDNHECTENVEDPNQIWSTKEVPTILSACDNPNDDRDEPTYQIYFKQEVGTEDIFLGTDKSPGSFDCSYVVVKVHFPNASIDELNLDVRSNSMIVESNEKKLSLTLPMDVDEEEGKAEWDSSKNTLSVTLPVK